MPLMSCCKKLESPKLSTYHQHSAAIAHRKIAQPRTDRHFAEGSADGRLGPTRGLLVSGGSSLSTAAGAFESELLRWTGSDPVDARLEISMTSSLIPAVCTTTVNPRWGEASLKAG